MKLVRALAAAALLTSGCIRMEFDLCEEDPPHPDCQRLDAGPPSDGGDAAAEQDAGTDAGADLDAGTDAGADLDAGTDAGATDAGTDAGATDAGTDLDAAVDADV